jgi:hypothetical protein
VPKTGRSLIGIVAGFKSEWWPVFDRNAGRLHVGIRIRDGTGRLLVASPFIEKRTELEAAIKTALGGYASAVPVVEGAAAERLLKDPSRRRIAVEPSNNVEDIHYIDRRFIGADWLLPPVSEVLGARRLVFGSLKGGVGRSTALAVLAAELAKSGKRVLCIDLDLEAPGIGSMLLPYSEDEAIDRRPKYGVVDYLLENGINGIADHELYDFVGVSTFHEGSIDVIPAVGRDTDADPTSMIAKLSRALVEDRQDGKSITLTAQVREMVDRFSSRAVYDVVLIDARAGMAEITAAPLLGLGAEIFLFGVDQPQTFRGYAYILSHLASVGAQAGEQSWRERITFVQAKAPSSGAKRQPFREALYELCAAYLYDQDYFGSRGEFVSGDFSPSITETGISIPHDATFIQYHPDYDAFDPIGDVTQLDPEVYNGPFKGFLVRALQIIGSDGAAK